jgi:hypothetical protein
MRRLSMQTLAVECVEGGCAVQVFTAKAGPKLKTLNSPMRGGIFQLRTYHIQ